MHDDTFWLIVALVTGTALGCMIGAALLIALGV